ncbi:hypothetical protein B0H14DRAFT_2630170 [Mycena olivaceomarginata]|nr:hypothetical protein B0H14DRAFT_2630170 [Mycena olivaceomarginata]
MPVINSQLPAAPSHRHNIGHITLDVAMDLELEDTVSRPIRTLSAMDRTSLRIAYVVYATRRPPVTWALGSVRRVLPSDAQCVPRSVDSLDLGCRVAMDRPYARRVLPSDAHYVVYATRRPPVTWALGSVRRVLPSDAQCVPRSVDSLDLGCRVAMDRPYARRVLPSDAHYVVCATRRPPVTWALGSVHRVLPSDVQCVPRSVDSPDFGRRVAMDCTSPRRVLPSDAQCVPRSVDSLDLGCRVAMDPTYARRVLPSDAQCVPRWVDSPDFERHGPYLSAHSLRRLRHPPPTGHLGAWVFWTLDAVLPWTVPMRAVSSRQMPSVCLDGLTVRILSAMDRTSLRIAYVVYATRRPPVTWALGSVRRVLPSDAQCVPRSVDSLDLGCRVAMDRPYARRVLPSDAHYVVCATRRPPVTWALGSVRRVLPSDVQCVPRSVDSPDFGRRVAMDCTSPRRVLPSDAQCVPRSVDSLDLGCRVAMDPTYARRVLPSDAHYVVYATRRPPVTWALGSVRRVLPSDAHYVVYATRRPPVTWALGSVRRVLPSDVQCVPRSVDSPDFGRRVAMDCTSPRRVLPSDAQCVPRSVDSLDLGCRVAMDRPYARRVLPSDAQCVPRWVDSPDFERHGPYLSAHSLRRLRHPPPTGHLGAWVFWTLDAVLPWTVPMRAVSSRQMPSVCLDGLTVRILSAMDRTSLRIAYVVYATRRPPVTWALGSVRRVLPSDVQCVPRSVDSPDFGRRVAMDCTSPRRVLPSDAQCVPRSVDSLDLGCRVAMDPTYARRVLPSDAHYVVYATRRPPVTWALGPVRRVLPSDAQCVPRWVDSPDFERHGPYLCA